ncbi:MAG: ABC transporter substrate-binding protein [Acidobacteriota bacterium]
MRRTHMHRSSPYRLPLNRLLILPVLALLATGCETEPPKIGAVLPLSGADEGIGQSSKRGLELALEELAAEGSQLQLVFEDSQSDPEEAGRKLGTLIRDGKALAAVGAVTPGEAEAMAPVAEELEHVLLSPSAGNQQLSAKTRHFYRLAPADSTAGSTLATFAAKDLKATSAVMISENAGWGAALEEGFRPIFEGQNGEVLESLEAPSAEADLTTAVEQVGTAKPDAVVLAGYGDWLTTAIRQLRSSGYEGRVLTTQTIANKAQLQSLKGQLRGVLFSHSPFIDVERPETQKFLDAYRTKYNEEPDIFAAEAYDTLKVLALALEGRPQLASEVRRGLRDAVKDHPGATGNLEFDDTGSVSKFPRVYSADADGALFDYGDQLAALEEERRKKMKEIQERLQALQSQASSM